MGTLAWRGGFSSDLRRWSVRSSSSWAKISASMSASDARLRVELDLCKPLDWDSVREWIGVLIMT